MSGRIPAMIAASMQGKITVAATITGPKVCVKARASGGGSVVTAVAMKLTRTKAAHAHAARTAMTADARIWGEPALATGLLALLSASDSGSGAASAPIVATSMMSPPMPNTAFHGRASARNSAPAPPTNAATR